MFRPVSVIIRFLQFLLKSVTYLLKSRSVKSNSHTSNFAKHLNEQAHSFGSIHNTMEILKRQNK